MNKFINYYKQNKYVIWFLIILFLIKIILIRYIGNFEFEPDGYWHTVFNNTVFIDFPNNLKYGLSVWAKPGFTYLFGLISVLFNIESLFIYKLLNVIITTIYILLIYHIFKDKFKLSQRTNIILLSILSLSFTLFRSSISAMTENIFVLIIIGVIYLFFNNKYKLALLLTSILTLFRFEGVIYIPFFLLMYLGLSTEKLRTKIFATVLVFVPTLIWNYFGYLQTGNILYIIKDGYPINSVGIYGFGNWSSFLKGFVLQDLTILMIFFICILFFFKNTKAYVSLCQNYIKNRVILDKFQFIIILSSILIFLHTAILIYLWKFGLSGSAGLMRYFVSIIPILIVVFGYIVSKYDFFIKKGNTLKIVVLLAIFTSITQLYSNFFIYQDYFMNVRNFPIQFHKVAEDAVYLKKHINKGCILVANEPNVIYFAGMNLTNATLGNFDSKNIHISEKKIYATDDEAFVKKLQILKEKTFSIKKLNTYYILYNKECINE